MKPIIAIISRSSINPKAFVVWVRTPIQQGRLRQGFAWKTLRGAENAVRKAFPQAQVTVNI